MSSKKEKSAIILNLLLVIFEIIGLIVYMSNNKYFQFEYYTQDSNLFALVIGIIYLVFLLAKKEIPKWLGMLKYMSVLSLTITFLVVVFILSPMYNFNYVWMMTSSSMLYYHTICPILAFVSFIFFEKNKISGLKDNIRALYFTIIYTILIIIFNIIGFVEGPYPFLMIKKNSIIESIIWLLVIDGGAFALSYLIMLLKNKVGVKDE